MATVIKRKTLSEPTFACLLGERFEKNSTFDTSEQLTYILVQNGKMIGSTTGKTQYGNKEVKLNKKFFPDLKCGLFSKNVDVEMFYIKHHYGFGFSQGQRLSIFGSFPRNVPADKSFKCLGIDYMVELNMSDPKKAYESFFIKTNTSYITVKSMNNFCIEVGKDVLDVVTKNLSFGPETRFPNLKNENNLQFPETKEIFTKFKELYEKTWKDFGYNAKVSLPRG